jgi:hypothetical protein
VTRSTSIVQTRAFSFSDDGANVALPFATKALSPPASPEQQGFWVQSNESALDFFRLRTIQSSWYTELFQSGRDAWADPYPYIWGQYHKMSEWFNKLSSNTLPATRDFFETELLYSYVYILSPNLRCPNIGEHAYRLIFEHCITYAEKMLFIASSPSDMTKTVSFYDALRVYMTARHFVDALTEQFDTLLRPTATSVTPTSGFTAQSALDAEVDPLAAQTSEPPPIPAIAADTPGGLPKDQTSRAIDTINNFVDILSYFGARFGNVGSISWRDRFQRESQSLLSNLHQRRHQQNQLEQGYPLFNGGPVTPPTHLSSSPQPSGTFYPSPASTHYSPAAGYVQMNPSDLRGSWDNGASAGNSQFLSVTSAGEMSGGMLAPIGVDNLGIGSYAAWETLPGGSLNPRFAL